MKKTFYPLNFGYLIIFLMSIFFICLGTYMVIIGVYILLVHSQCESIVLVISGLITTILFLFVIIYNLHNKIILKDEKIIITSHWIIRNEGLQYPDEIEYREIQNVAIVYANANSLKKKIKKAGYSSLRPFTYYELILKNGSTKWIYRMFFKKAKKTNIKYN